MATCVCAIIIRWVCSWCVCVVFFCCTCIIIKEQLLMQQLHPNQRSIFIVCQNHHHHLQARFCKPKKPESSSLLKPHSHSIFLWKIWFLLYVVQNQGLNKKINCESKESENKIAKQQEAALICELCFATGSCNRFWERFLQTWWICAQILRVFFATGSVSAWNSSSENRTECSVYSLLV